MSFRSFVSIYRSKFSPLLVSAVGLLWVLSTYWLLSSFYGAESEFSRLDRTTIFFEVGVVVFLQSVLIVIVDRLFRRHFVSALLASLIIVLNAYSLNLVFDEQFLALGRGGVALCLAAGAAIPFVLISAMVDSKNIRITALSLGGVLAVAPVLLAVASSEKGGGSSTGSIVFPNVVTVPFTSKPNVYLIGFDSMAPQAVLSEYLGLDNAPLPQAIIQLGFRRLPNLFSEAVPTKPAITNLLALNTDYFFDEVLPDYNLFSGEAPSPLLQIFSENGYETNTLYSNDYFGEKRGPYVDHYVSDREFSVCTHLEDIQHKTALFGLCELHQTSQWRALHGLKENAAKREFEFLMGYLDELMERSKPQLFVAHVHPPNHTASTFQTTPEQIQKFRTTYLEMSEVAAENLQRLTNVIAERDPTGILFVFGDHGTWISRTINFAEDPKFFIQDRFGVLGGIFPSSVCLEQFSEPVPERFLTTPRVARMIITCLSGGADPFTQEYDYRIRARNARYEDFLYD